MFFLGFLVFEYFTKRGLKKNVFFPNFSQKKYFLNISRNVDFLNISIMWIIFKIKNYFFEIKRKWIFFLKNKKNGFLKKKFFFENFKELGFLEKNS